jgi:hypothetical protein
MTALKFTEKLVPFLSKRSKLKLYDKKNEEIKKWAVRIKF